MIVDRWTFEQRATAMVRCFMANHSAESVAEYFGVTRDYVVDVVTSSFSKTQLHGWARDAEIKRFEHLVGPTGFVGDDRNWLE